jgi:hypothetical protein
VLLLQSEIAKLRKPDKRVLDTYKQWFLEPHPPLGGQAKRFLDNEDDLVALKVSETDYLSQFLRRHWPVQVTISSRFY